ncbi:MAG: response regulator transcription factor [Oligoflexales bacterium]
MSKKRILLVEDEPHLAFNLEYNLVSEGYEIVRSADGETALTKYLTEGPFDLIILDIMIPELDGFEVAKRVRTHDKATGILMLTARATETDIVTGLELGADDYITKPFQLKELLLRVKRMLERSELMVKDRPNPDPISVFGISLDIENLKVTSQNGSFPITALEADVLQQFIMNPKKILSRDFLLRTVWRSYGNLETRTVDNFIMRIRKYIDLPNLDSYIQTVRGKGYRLVDPQKLKD